MFKNIAIGLGVVIVVIAVGVYYLSQNAGNLVAGVIKVEGSRVTQVPVDVDAVDISLTELKAGLRGLTVANPAGFKTERAISLGEISVKIAKDWSMDVIVIDEVLVNAPEITYEIGTGGSNISAIQKNVEDSLKAMGGSDGKKATSSSAQDSAGGDKAGPKIIINNFYIKNGKVHVSSTLLQGKTLPVALPEIHLKDIGKDNKDGSDGASTAQVIDEVMSAITKKAGAAASSLDLSALGLSDISGKAAKVGAAAKDAATGALKGVGDKLGGAGEGVGGAVKGLFEY